MDELRGIGINPHPWRAGSSPALSGPGPEFVVAIVHNLIVTRIGAVFLNPVKDLILRGCGEGWLSFQLPDLVSKSCDLGLEVIGF
jgi:hypothetical protein